MGDHFSSFVHKVEDAAGEVASALHAAAANLPIPLPSLHVDPSSILQHPNEKEYMSQISPEDIRDAPLPSYDPGVFNNELLALNLYSTVDPNDPKKIHEPAGNIEQGTYAGTQVALTQLYARIEQT